MVREREMEEELVATTTTQTIRIYVGGLGESVSSDDLRKIFSSMGMGSVLGVDIIRTKGRSFAYIDFFPASEKSLSKLFSTYNGCVWKGGRLRLEKAKENYLARLRREWAEYAELASSSPVSGAEVDNDISSSKKPNEAPISEKKLLKIFFPRLRKMKSLPFSGTGKHKYSFQRVEVPSLPKYFCDCEEHSSPHTTEVKHIHDLESQVGGMNEEELNMMNSVMNRLFQRENVLNTAHSGTRVENEREDTIKPIEDPQFDDNEMDLEADEDNIIINVVSTRNNRLPMSGSQQHETVSVNQKLGFNERQTSKDGPMVDVVKGQKRNNVSSNKKRKSVIHEESERNESMPADPEGNGSSQAQSSGSKTKTVLGARNTEPELAIKRSSSSFSWSQKSSWKLLVGDGGNSAFSVSNFLPGISSNIEEQPRSDQNVPKSTNNKNLNLAGYKNLEGQSGMTDVMAEYAEAQSTKLDADLTKSDNDGPTQDVVKGQKRSSEPPNKKKKSAIREEIGRDAPMPADPEDERNSQTYANVSGKKTILGAQPIEPESGAKQSASSLLWSESSTLEALTGDGDNGAFSVSHLFPSITSTEEELLRSDSPDVPKSIDRENQNLVMNKNVEGKSCKREVSEGLAEAQPTKPNVASKNSGRGSSWLQKSSWTQLVSENNGSFSLTHILPGVTFEKHEVIGPNSVDVANSTDSKHDDIEKERKNKFGGDDSPALGVVMEGIVVKSIPDSQQTVVSNEEASTHSAPVVDEKCDPAPKKRFSVNSGIGETCSFMRTAASLKEWANAKKAVSGSRKRIMKSRAI